MRALVILLISSILCSGCLSVCRLGKCESKYGSAKEWSEERQEWVRVEVHRIGDPDILAKFGLYPTMKMRWQLARVSCHWAPKRTYWSQHLGVPVALIGITPGMVVDFVVDTIALPWDWKYRNNVGPDLCAPLDAERACRSLCVMCGATSDGEFSRCRRKADRGTDDHCKYYGVCPRCIDAAKAAGTNSATKLPTPGSVRLSWSITTSFTILASRSISILQGF